MDRDYANYLLKKTIEDYNQIAEDFSSTRNHMWEETVFLERYTLAGEKILDLGCGNGRLYDFLKPKSIDYYGVDVSGELIKIARGRYPEANFQVTNALSLPFPDNFFDKIYCIAVLHHIPSKELRFQFLKEAQRVLKSKGVLVLTVWNLWQRKTAWKLLLKHTTLKILGKSKLDFKDIFYPWKNFERRMLVQRYFHLFTKIELKGLAEKVGFKGKEVGILKRPKSKESNIYLIAEK